MEQDYLYVLNCIESSKNKLHMDGCIIMKALFITKHLKDPDKKMFDYYVGMLTNKLSDLQTHLNPDA